MSRPNPFSDPNLTVDDIMRDPKKYGAPTFEEFQRNYPKYTMLQQQADPLTAMDGGPQNFRKDLRKIKYFWNGEQLTGPAQVESRFKDHGLTIEDLTLVGNDGASRLKRAIEVIPLGGGKYDIEVSFSYKAP